MKRVIEGVSFYGSLIDDNTIDQVVQLSKEKWLEGSKIAIMPDAHVGKGTSIGTSIALQKEAISPNVVGVDIGCGVLVAELSGITPNQLLNNIDAFEKEMRRAIPTGYNINKKPRVDFDLSELITPLNSEQEEYMKRSLCTLGGGNHFIEVGVSDKKVFVVVHTGSRNLGVQVHGFHQERAEAASNEKVNTYEKETKELIQLYKDSGRQREISSLLKDRYDNQPVVNLRDAEAFLEGELYNDYINDMKIAQEFAATNRSRILKSVVMCMQSTANQETEVVEMFDSPHNYIDLEHNIVRKGAISARSGERVAIPLGPSAGTVIGFGKGLAEANYSAPHGAGRSMSRAQAREMLTVDDMSKAMEGVYSGAISDKTIDEAPQAYKDAEVIKNEISSLIEIEKIITPIYSFKSKK